MGLSRDKVFLFVAIVCLSTSVCLSEYPQKDETVFSVGSSSDENPHSRGSFLSWFLSPMWTNTRKRREDPVIHMFGEGDDNEKIDLLLPGQELKGEKVSSFLAAKPSLEPYTPAQTPSSTSPLAPPSPVHNSPPLVAPTPSPSSQSPSPLPPSAPISPPPTVSPSIPPPPSTSPSPTSFPSSTAPSSTPYPFPSFPPSPITPSLSPASFPSVTPPSTPSPIKPPSPTLSPTLPPPIFPPSVSPPIIPPFVSPPIFPPFPSVSPPTFPPSPSPSPSVSPPIFPPSSSSSPSLTPPVFPALPPQPPSQSPPPSPTPSPVPTSPSPSLTPSVTPPQPFPLPTPTPSPSPTSSSPTPSLTPSPSPTPLSPTPSPSPTPLSPTPSPFPTPSGPTASPSPTPSPVPTPSNISILTNLAVSNGAKLVPDFNPFVFSYKVSFDSKIRRFLVIAYLPEDEEDYKYSSLHLESLPLKSGEKSPPLKLGKRGETVTFHIYVRAVNHVATTYVLSVTREAGHKGLGTVAIIFVVLACMVGALILLVTGYAAYVYARTGRMLQLRDFQFSRGRDSSLYTPLV